ncbi:MAG: glycosyltransferase [Actinomycetota bacterium]|nr:glycosyltransferase [Actinomycetota bacterium]
MSVLIPTFNYAHYLEECVRSVRRQTFTNVEIIVIDDCSTDNTHAVVTALAEHDLRYVRHETNRGPAVARNTGLRMARGRYVALIDADDLMTPENLSRKVAVLERHPGVALVHSGAVPIDERGRAITPSGRHASKPGGFRLEDPFPGILYENPIIASAAVVRKDPLDRLGGFDPQLRRAEDWDLWVRLARSSRFAYIDEPLVRVRIHMGGNQWDSFATGQDFDAATQILRKTFDEFRLEDEGYSFRELYWDQYYIKLGNKAGVLPFRSFAKMYFHGLRQSPAGAFRSYGIRTGVKVIASAFLPRRLIRWLRLRRQARQIAGIQADGGARLRLKRTVAPR